MAIRKYLSEFGVNTHAVFLALVQQADLPNLAKYSAANLPPIHLYMIARRPRIALDPASLHFTEKRVSGRIKVQRGDTFEVHEFDVNNGLGTADVKVQCAYPYTEYIFRDGRGHVLSQGKVANLVAAMAPELSRLMDLEVLYVGQSYGVDGAREAPERLAAHATLQGIYAEAIRRAPDQEIWIVLLSIEDALLVSFDGRSKEFGTTQERDKEHVEQTLRTPISPQQLINYTEAALIRYFAPEYNVTFKKSFPSPAHETYSECYELDLNSVSVTVDTENIHCRLWSSAVSAKWIHFSHFELHSTEERKSMFDFS